ncbi:hypothetical protein M422DRAFT_249648 [Sphaerobolus stellatus SS14]|uniref:Uncharacterized protein n=1 Tax=Sphaerobolus stellatus (strain SS14) TaxID=990650 RepID=A0A0C9W3Z9_SPHS4|nr:hypothetical protein M422DRAFT_249648 [Sphaerobolus stellatus SS14]
MPFLKRCLAHGGIPIQSNGIPECIDFRPDGTGTISSSFKVFTGQQVISDVASQEFFWKLGRDGPLVMEGIDLDALYHIFPKLMTSTRAWTTRTWTVGFVPAYFQIILSEQNSLEKKDRPPIADGFAMGDTSEGTYLPVELIDYIFRFLLDDDDSENNLLYVCKRTREMLLRRRRLNCFSVLVERFSAYGMSFWITCGHFRPEYHSRPTFYAFHAFIFKLPYPCGYPDSALLAGNTWMAGWDPRRNYYACELEPPRQTGPTFWRKLHGDVLYDEHPKVPKLFDEL